MKTIQKPAPVRADSESNDSTAETLSLLKAVKLPTKLLPAKMVVAIDGWAQSGKNTAGELVAEAIGGVLVDSGRFYRALTKACLIAGVDLNNAKAVAQFCWGVPLDVRTRHEGGKCPEAQVAVCGKWFTKEELNGVSNETSAVARVPEVREVVTRAMWLCGASGRVVMLGRDIGGVVMPGTPYKFFLNASDFVREQRHVRNMGRPGAIRRDHADQGVVVIAEDALKIDTGELKPDEVRGIILLELFRRASEQSST